jgi:hypothetical protein
MSNLTSFGVLNEKVNKVFNDENCDTKGNAFMRFALSLILKLNDDDIEDCLTDGPMDGEMDAIYISNRDIHILTFKYTDNFESTKKNYPGTDIDQFVLTLDQIVSGNLDEITINSAVWDKYSEIKSLSQTGKVNFKVYVVSNKLYPDTPSQTKLGNLFNKYRIIEKPIYLNQEDIVTKILDYKTKQIDGKVTFVDTQHFEKSNGDLKTIIGAISASDIIELIKSKEDPNIIDEDVFNENIRVYKFGHQVNQAIIGSANQNTNHQFFYLNNGITLLCEDEDYVPHTKSPTVNLTKVQIINGGQTSHSLFEVYKLDPEKIKTIEILIRLCITKRNKTIGERISESTNNQIPVASRDLHSNDSVQRKLEEEFELLGYFYERKPNQYPDQPLNKILNNELLGQLYMAYYLDMPSEAKNNKAKVFTDLYSDIFNEQEVSAKKLLRVFEIYQPILEKKKVIQSKKRKKEQIDEKEAFVSRATFHILNSIKLIAENKERAILDSDLTKEEKKTKIEEIYESTISAITDRAIDLIQQVVNSEMTARGQLYTHDKFFKELPTNNIIKTHILKSLEIPQQSKLALE